MEQKIKSYMEEHHMTDPGDHLIVGVSGGADSVALLLILWRLKEKLGVTLEAAHVEHGIRGEESRQDAAFVEKLCEELQICSICFRVDVPAYAALNGMGTEEAARALRYGQFGRLADKRRQEGAGNVKIALAHHREDNAETVLFQLARGSGIDGLCGIAPVQRGELFCIRPLLGSSRKEIEDYLRTQGRTYRVDSTNFDDTYTRNRIRHEIIPRMEGINPRTVEHINQSAEQLAQIRDFLKEEAARAFVRVAEEQGSAVVLEIESLQQLHQAVRGEVLKTAVFRASGRKKDIGAVHLRQLSELLGKQSGRQIELPFGLLARREFGSIRIEKRRKKEGQRGQKEESVWVAGEKICGCRDGFITVELGGKGETIEIEMRPCGGSLEEIVKKTYTKCLNYDKIKDGFCIRHRRPGDYFICDTEGRHKRLKEYLIEEKIPAEKRDELWLAARGSEVIWLIGGRIGENYKVTADARQMAVLTYRQKGVNSSRWLP